MDITLPITVNPARLRQRCKLNFISFLMSTLNGVLIAAGWRRRQLDTLIRRQLTRHTKTHILWPKKRLALCVGRAVAEREPARARSLQLSPNALYVNSYTATHFNFMSLYKAQLDVMGHR